MVQVVYRDKRGVEYDSVPLPTHEVTDAERAALPTAEPKRRPMTPAARAAFGMRMKACWAKRKRAQLARARHPTGAVPPDPADAEVRALATGGQGVSGDPQEAVHDLGKGSGDADGSNTPIVDVTPQPEGG